MLTFGCIHPLSKALSMMAHSMFLMVTGGSEIPNTHAPSHGAGHTRPVNSDIIYYKINTYIYGISSYQAILMINKKKLTREVVSLQQLLQGLLPISMINQIVPLGYNIAQRTAMIGLTERYSTLHTTCSLYSQPATNMIKVIYLVPVPESLLRRTIQRRLAWVLYEASVDINNIFIRLEGPTIMIFIIYCIYLTRRTKNKVVFI